MADFVRPRFFVASSELGWWLGASGCLELYCGIG